MAISMDGRRRWMDNVFVERLWRTVKYEDFYLSPSAAPRPGRSGAERRGLLTPRRRKVEHDFAQIKKTGAVGPSLPRETVASAQKAKETLLQPDQNRPKSLCIKGRLVSKERAVPQSIC